MENVNQWLDSCSENGIIVYSDGSQKINNPNEIIGTGAAWILKWKSSWLGSNGFALGANAEVYDAEAWGMCGGLEAARTSPMSVGATGIHVCLDNLSVAQAAGSVPNGSSQGAFKKFYDMAENWLGKGKILTAQWISSHSGLRGNEVADTEAKKYAQLHPNPRVSETQTLSHAHRVIKARKDKAWIEEWEKLLPSASIQSYKDLGLKPSTKAKSMPELKLKREVLGWLIAARSGYGYFADYHERFGHEEVDYRC